MPHWLSAIICNAVCHLKRDLKKLTTEKTNGESNELLAIKNKLHLLFLKTSSVPLKHKVQSGIAAPWPFPASFIGHFTAIFYAHEREINVEISSLGICFLFFF